LQADDLRIINDLTKKTEMLRAEENKMATHAMAFSTFSVLSVLGTLGVLENF
jgi:hypothetical protein